MNKLSNRSIEKIKLFLADEEFSYISLTRHELKILFSIYNSVISIISESELKINNLEQTLNKIKELVIELKDDSDSFDFDIVKEHKETILQIIDKVGGNDDIK